jgi:hypothetical protein
MESVQNVGKVGTSERLFESGKLENDVAINITRDFAGRRLKSMPGRSAELHGYAG